MISFDSLKRGSHVFVAYYSKVLELYDFYSYLKNGLDNNELVIVFLETYSKDKLDDHVKKFISFTNYKDYKMKDSMYIKTTEEWFNPDECSNSETFFKRWEMLVTNAIKMRKEGIRIFIETNKFMREKFDNALIFYDKILQDLLDFPITSMYIYKKEDIQAMTPQQIAILNSSHGYHFDELLVPSQHSR
jgi:hypothetical protein